MNDPDWLRSIALSSASVPERVDGWCCTKCRDHYVKQVSRTDVPLMRDKLRLLAGELERDAAELDRLQSVLGSVLGEEDFALAGERIRHIEAALTAYETGPERAKKGEKG